MKRLEKKVSIITGAASGFGEATACKFAAEGSDLVLVDMNEAGLASVKERIGRDWPGTGVLLQCADVSAEDEVRNFVDAAVAEYGRIDVIFNNAGIEGFTSPMEEVDFELFQKTLRINLNSVFLGIKYAARFMKAHGGGAIVNTGSLGSVMGLPTSTDYVTAKHGVVGLTRNAAKELGQFNIRTNCVCPGVFMTGLHKRTMENIAKLVGEDVEKMYEGASNDNPMKRYGKVEEVANVVAFLASDEASYVNGVVLMVDGGMTA